MKEEKLLWEIPLVMETGKLIVLLWSFLSATNLISNITLQSTFVSGSLETNERRGFPF